MPVTGILELVPWPKLQGARVSLPPGSRLACICSIHIVVDTIDEAVFFHRTPEHDELWSVSFLDGPIEDLVDALLRGGEIPCSTTLGWGRTVVGSRRGSDDETAALDMFEALIRARADYAAPVGFTTAGIINRAAYDLVVARLEARHRSGQANGAEPSFGGILATAESIGLRPTPGGPASWHWTAGCPGTGHRLDLDTRIDSFHCGYCRRGGNARELAAFGAERGALGPRGH